MYLRIESAYCINGLFKLPKKEGSSDTSIVGGRKYAGEDSIVYIFAMPDQTDPSTEVSDVFGINGALLSQLEKSFDCYISIEKHPKVEVIFRLRGRNFGEKDKRHFARSEKRRKKCGTLFDLC
jgi:hypothetical protein